MDNVEAAAPHPLEAAGIPKPAGNPVINTAAVGAAVTEPASAQDGASAKKEASAEEIAVEEDLQLARAPADPGAIGTVKLEQCSERKTLPHPTWSKKFDTLLCGRHLPIAEDLFEMKFNYVSTYKPVAEEGKATPSVWPYLKVRSRDHYYTLTPLHANVPH